MGRFWFFVGVVLFMASANSSAETWMKWKFIELDKNSRGHKVCILFSASKISKIKVKSISIKKIETKDNLLVTIQKDGWSIPEGTDIPITMDFGDNVLNGIADGEGNLVNVYLPTDGTYEFLSRILNQRSMKINFEAGNEKPWVVPLKVASKIMKAFLACSTQSRETQPH